MNEERTTGREIRLLNKRRILRYIFRQQQVTKQRLVEALGISLPTVLQNVKELLAEELIREVGPMRSTGGRKAVAIAPMERARYAVGMDVTRGHLDLAMVDLCGSPLAQARLPRAFAREDEYFDWLGARTRAFIDRTGVDKNLILGVGVAVSGIIDAPQTMVTRSHTLGVRSMPCSIFEQRIDYPCVFSNDASASGFAEAWAGGHGPTFAYLMLSEVVGGAFFIDGRMHTGFNNRASEFGHQRLYPHGRVCYCGMEGCADSYLAAAALSGAYGADLGDFFTRLDGGDPDALQKWYEYLDALCLTVANLNMAYDCPVVIGGTVGGFIGTYIGEIRRRARKLNLFDDGDIAQPCAVRNFASAIGAALMHVEAFFGGAVTM